VFASHLHDKLGEMPNLIQIHRYIIMLGTHFQI
jgi:hypothetical protein